jgi:hypothetical protein
MHLFGDSFHEACGYFYIHIGEAEKEYKVQSVVSAARACKTEQDLRLLAHGFYAFLELLAGFWDGLYAAIADSGNGYSASTESRQATARRVPV